METQSTLKTGLSRPDTSGPADPLLRVSTALSDFWSYPLLRQRRFQVLLMAVVIGYCVARALIGVAGSKLFSHDAFLALDGAWRMMNGQRPDADFSSLVGFLAYVPTLVGLKLSAGHAIGFAYGQALVALVTAAWAYLIGRSRLSDVPLAIFCVAVAFTAAAPFPSGFSPLLTSPAMTYNRYGNVLLALLLIECLARPRQPNAHQEFGGGFSTGLVTASLLFLKLPFFLSAVLLIACLFFSRTQAKARWAGIVTGFISLLLPSLVYYRFHLKPVFDDLLFTARVHHVWTESSLFASSVRIASVLLSLALCAAVLRWTFSRRDLSWRIRAIGVVLALCGTLAVLGIFRFSGFSLALFIAIVAIEAMVKYRRAGTETDRAFEATVLLLGSLLITAPLLTDVTGMLAGLYGSFVAARQAAPINSERLHDFIPVGADESYTRFVNDGIGLLRRERRADENVMSLDLTNPFSYALGTRPTPGGTNALQYDPSITHRFKQTPEYLVGSADLVMLPKKISDPTFEMPVSLVFAPYLKRYFNPVGESTDWKLFRRKHAYTIAKAFPPPNNTAYPVLLLAPIGNIPYATDTNGHVIWYIPRPDLGIGFMTRPGVNGNFFIGASDSSGIPTTRLLREYDLAGNLVRDTNTTAVNEQLKARGADLITSFHHEILPLPNRWTALITSVEKVADQGAGPVDVLGDQVVIIDENMQVKWTWSEFDHLDIRRPAILGETCRNGQSGCPFLEDARYKLANDWTHSNGLTLTHDGNMLISIRHQDWIIKFRYDNGHGDGAILWRLGPNGDFKVNSSEPHPWFSHQHDPEIEPSGLLSVFDNGNTRAQQFGGNNRGQVWRLDEVHKTATLVYNIDLGLFSWATGSAQRLSNGNYTFNLGFLGTTSTTREFSPDGVLASEQQASQNSYRSFRMRSIYSEQ